jgi:hypothetical protein
MRPAPAKLTAQVHWIDLDPAYFERTQRYVWRVVAPMIVLGLAALSLVYLVTGDLPHSRPRSLPPLFSLVVMTLVVGVTLPFAGRIARHKLKGYRLGASLDGLSYEVATAQAPFGLGRAGRVPWREVYYDGRFLLAGRRLLPVRRQQGGAFFDAAALDTWIVANVPSGNRISTVALMLRSTVGRILVALALAIAVIGLLSALILS